MNSIMSICLFVFLILVTLPITIVMMIGAWRMRRLENYPLCVAAAVVAVLPVHAGFLLGLPFGVWALSLLFRPEVKAAFHASARRRGAKQ